MLFLEFGFFELAVLSPASFSSSLPYLPFPSSSNFQPKSSTLSGGTGSWQYRIGPIRVTHYDHVTILRLAYSIGVVYNITSGAEHSAS